MEIANSQKKCSKMVTNIFKTSINHLLLSSNSKSIIKTKFLNWSLSRWMLDLYSMKMAPSTASLTKLALIPFCVEMDVDQILNRFWTKFIEFFHQMEFIFALLTVYQTIDLDTSTKKNTIGPCSLKKQQNQRFRRQQSFQQEKKTITKTSISST